MQREKKKLLWLEEMKVKCPTGLINTQITFYQKSFILLQTLVHSTTTA